MFRHDSTNRSSISSTSSAWSDASRPDRTAPPADEPAPNLVEHSQADSDHPPPEAREPRRQRRISSAGGDDDDATELWRCMVELQQRYGCYRSARMQAAASGEGAAEPTPSRACLNLLNDDVADEDLPEEAWQILGRFVVDGARGPMEESGQRKVWWKW